MKIRTDFVTNSSSSSFCTITVNTTDGEKISIFDELWLQPNLLCFNNVKNIKDLIDVIAKQRELWYSLHPPILNGNFTSLEQKDQDFFNKLSQVKDLSMIESIEMEDGNYAWEECLLYPDDEGDEWKEGWEEVIFDEPDEGMQTCINRYRIDFKSIFKNRRDSEVSESPDKNGAANVNRAIGNSTINFNNKIFVHTGLNSKDTRLVEKAIMDRGGIVKGSVVLNTDYLIYNPDYDHVTVKYNRAQELIAEGRTIRMMTTEEFCKWLETGEDLHEEISNDIVEDEEFEPEEITEDKQEINTVNNTNNNVFIIPKKIITFEDNAFANRDCEYVTIPYGLAAIGKCAFKDCIKLKNITIPNSVELIDERAFEGCINLESISIPDSVMAIGSAAFWKCEKLARVIIPYGLNSIEDSVFTDCKSLNNINIPNSITSIGNFAFAKCKSLQCIYIPRSVEYIGHNAFYHDPWEKSDSMCVEIEIHAPAGSYAIEYAKKNGIKYVEEHN